MWYGCQLPKDDLDIGLILNPEEVFSHQTEMVDKVMMIFINSWKLKLFVNSNYMEK
jgi:hypothetical protein